MPADEGDRRRHPTWVRCALVGLQALGIVGGLVLGNLTYRAWSDADPVEDAPTTTTVTPAVPVPEDTLG
jgi:hypothetical protein